MKKADKKEAENHTASLQVEALNSKLLGDKEATDEEIVKRIQKGETQLFDILVVRYEKKMARYASKFLFGYDDSKDLIQDIFIKAYVNIQSFDSSRVFSPWLYRIAHNEFINAIKKRGKEKLTFFDPDTLFPHPVYEDHKEEEMDAVELKKMLDVCIDKLDPKYREPLVLFYYEDIDYKRIAEILRIPVSTVGIRLKRGKVSLKKIFDKLFPNHT